MIRWRHENREFLRLFFVVCRGDGRLKVSSSHCT